MLTALTCPKGEVATNLCSHLDLVEHGRATECDLVLLPEMSLTGYQASAAITLDDPAVDRLVAASAGGPALCFGLVESSSTTDPRPFITQVLAVDGAAAVVHRKAGLATDEQADFQRGEGSGQLTVAGEATALAVCAEIGSQPPYAQGASLVLGPAAPGLYGPRRVTEEDWQRGYDWWRASVLGDATRLLPTGSFLAVSTQAGATVDEDFPGWAALIDADGQLVAELTDHHQGTLVVTLGAD
ncbi:MAG: nitrilase-related carbon-nitrogen hydrolase [Propionibacteriaceae bacterium]